MENLSKEVKIDPIIIDDHHKITELKFEISHDSGGFSYATDEYRKTGVRLDVKPVCRDPKYPNLYSVVYDGKKEHQGFYVFLCPCSRKSPKRMQKCADAILPMAEKMTDMFINGDYIGIAKLAQEATKDI
jgi:hypothetical protein